MGNIAAVLYLAVYILAGMAVARRLFKRDCRITRASLGAALALIMLMWLPALFSFVMGFTLAAQLLALAAAAGIGFAAYRGCADCEIERRVALKPYLACVIPVIAVMAYLLHTHTLLATPDGSLHAGQSTFGDMCMHLGIISSITRQGFFPPQYSILAGAPMSYPFLCDSVSSTFYTLGASLRFSYMLPMLLAFFSVASGVYTFFEGWFTRADKAALSFVLFFLGGGLGFAYFLDGSGADNSNFTRIFTAFYETPTNYVAENVRWVNIIADMFIPQRATLFGYALLFPCLNLLRRSAFDGRDDFVILGVMAGALPLVHTHSFLALGLVSIVWFARAIVRRERPVKFAVYGIIACAIAAPQLILFTFRQAGGFLQFNFNWANETDFFIWFYIKNVGLIFLLLPVALLAANERDRATWCGVALLWALAELIQFQPNPYDNNKLLFIWFAFSAGLAASFLTDVYEKLGGMRGRRLLALMTVAAMTLSGVLTLGREWVSRYELFNAHELEAARFIDENLPEDAVFLTANNHDNPVAVLTGRNIVCGSSSYLYYHGFETYGIEQDVARMYAMPLESGGLFEQYGVDYIYLGAAEAYAYSPVYSEFEGFELVFANPQARIYALGEH